MFTNTGFLEMNNGYSIFHALPMYLIGGKLRNKKWRTSIWEKLVFVVLAVCFEICLFIGLAKIRKTEYINEMFAYNSIFTMIISITLFAIACQQHLAYKYRWIKKTIGAIAESTLYIYLIDSSSVGSYFRNVMSNGILRSVAYVLVVVLLGVSINFIVAWRYKKAKYEVRKKPL